MLIGLIPYFAMLRDKRKYMENYALDFRNLVLATQVLFSTYFATSIIKGRSYNFWFAMALKLEAVGKFLIILVTENDNYRLYNRGFL